MFHHTIKCFVSAVVNEDCFKIKKKFLKKFMIVPFSRGQSHIFMLLSNAEWYIEGGRLPKKWKSMRDRFVRELRKIKELKSGDPGPPYKPSWPLFELLLFLSDSVHHRP